MDREAQVFSNSLHHNALNTHQVLVKSILSESVFDGGGSVSQQAPLGIQGPWNTQASTTNQSSFSSPGEADVTALSSYPSSSSSQLIFLSLL